jgi:Flp pilus assembly protein TadD
MPLLALLAAGCAGMAHPRPAAKAAAAAPADTALDGPAQSELYLGIVAGLIRQQRYGAAVAFLDDYAAKQPPGARYEMLRGDAMLGAGRHEEAVAAYTAALAYGSRAPAYNGIGRALSEQKRWAEAALNFRRAVTLDPTNADYLNNLGYAELKQDGPNARAAIADLRQAHELEPGSARIRNNLILAAAMNQDQAQYAALLSGISDSRERGDVARFAARWTGWSGPAEPKEKAVP